MVFDCPNKKVSSIAFWSLIQIGNKGKRRFDTFSLSNCVLVPFVCVFDDYEHTEHR